MFTGDVYVTSYANEPDAPTRLALVRFTPGAHTARHSHATGQRPHCTEGVGSDAPATSRAEHVAGDDYAASCRHAH